MLTPRLLEVSQQPACKALHAPVYRGLGPWTSAPGRLLRQLPSLTFPHEFPKDRLPRGVQGVHWDSKEGVQDAQMARGVPMSISGSPCLLVWPFPRLLPGMFLQLCFLRSDYHTVLSFWSLWGLRGEGRERVLEETLKDLFEGPWPY